MSQVLVSYNLPQILYGFHTTPFGVCLIGVAENSVCHLSFPENNTITALQKQWPESHLIHNQEATKQWIDHIFIEQKTPSIILKGTEFQVAVWKQLLNIPHGTTTDYQTIATRIGKPQGHRAVASAIARNSIAYLIPCHRVIHKSGTLSSYRWGLDRKINLLSAENAL